MKHESILLCLLFSGCISVAFANVSNKREGRACYVQPGHSTLKDECGDGLECRVNDGISSPLLSLFGRGICVRPFLEKRISERMECAQAQLRFQMIIRTYPEKWMPRCGSDGYFLPKQCDLGGRCFCVNRIGIIQTDRVNTTDITCPAFILPATLIQHTV